MPARKPPQPDEKPQFERFLETAREIGAAETDKGLEDVLRRVVRPSPATPPTPGPRRSRKQPH